MAAAVNPKPKKAVGQSDRRLKVATKTDILVVEHISRTKVQQTLVDKTRRIDHLCSSVRAPSIGQHGTMLDVNKIYHEKTQTVIEYPSHVDIRMNPSWRLST